MLPAAALLRVLPVLLAPGLLLVAALLLRGALTPTTWLALTRLSLAGLSLAGLALTRLTLAGASGLAVLRRLAGLRASWLLAPSAALLRGLPLLWGLLGTLTPTATTLGGRLLPPAAMAPLSPLLPARLAPRLLPRTPRSLRRRRHICSFDPRVDVQS
ncbi:hypothetical protein EV646_110135 [Kribbella antiqua]|uniref:Uncharacterized protein n=1 Tax=Kribbella antiqua TaxID=2512217 RepID=A0A4R2IHK3_9ACTN|nr:hypothetical protein [Kribbella antiqua]TCO44421.1 hypothetical protein EV646_110135 [Kribbella antiqua]